MNYKDQFDPKEAETPVIARLRAENRTLRNMVVSLQEDTERYQRRHEKDKMGSTFLVEIWDCADPRCETNEYRPWWRGDSLIKAIYQLCLAKRSGYRFATLNWNGKP